MTIIINGEEHKVETECDFWTAFNNYLRQKHLKASDVYKAVGFTYRTFSSVDRLKSDGTNNPSRKAAIKLTLGLKLMLNETHKLLAKAGYALSSSSEFDRTIMVCKEHGVHNVVVINEHLYYNNLSLLFDVEK